MAQWVAGNSGLLASRSSKSWGFTQTHPIHFRIIQQCSTMLHCLTEICTSTASLCKALEITAMHWRWRLQYNRIAFLASTEVSTLGPIIVTPGVVICECVPVTIEYEASLLHSNICAIVQWNQHYCITHVPCKPPNEFVFVLDKENPWVIIHQFSSWAMLNEHFLLISLPWYVGECHDIRNSSAMGSF